MTLTESARQQVIEALRCAESFVMIALPHYAKDRKEAVESTLPTVRAALALLESEAQGAGADARAVLKELMEAQEQHRTCSMEEFRNGVKARYDAAWSAARALVKERK